MQLLTDLNENLHSYQVSLDENIRSFIYFISGDAALEDDLVQEVLLKKWEMRRKLLTIEGNFTQNGETYRREIYIYPGLI